MKKNFYFILIIIAVLSSCKTNKNVVSSKKTDKTHTLTKTDLEVSATFIEASKQKALGNIAEAEALFKEAILINTNHAPSYYELGKICEIKKDYQQAAFYGRKAKNLDIDNKWYNIFYAEMLFQDKKYNEASMLYKEIALKYNDLDFYNKWVLALIYAEKYNESLKVLDKIEQIFGFEEEISLKKQKIYLFQNKIEQAANEIKKIIALYPTDSKYYLVLAEMYMQVKLYDKAYEQYVKVIELLPNDPMIHISLADYYRQKGDKVSSFNELKIAFQNESLDVDTKINILLSYFSVTEFYHELKSQAYDLLEILTKVHPKEPKGFSMLGDFLYRDKKFPEARDAFYKVIELDSSRYLVWETLLFVLSENKENEALINYSLKAKELFPEQPLPYLFVGMAYYAQKQYEKAIKPLQIGVDLVIDNKELLQQFKTYLGDVYYHTANYQKAFAIYDEIIKTDPTDAYVLNNYSYYLSVRGENIEKAIQMAKKAIEIEPNNDSYLDTYGWALYKSGNYVEAKKQIELAIKNSSSDNGEILEHYGDVLYKLGDIDNALKYWQKALDTKEASALIEKKIKEKKLYE